MNQIALYGELALEEATEKSLGKPWNEWMNGHDQDL